MKPYIVCHMIASIDGRIDCDMTEKIETGDEYYEALNALDCPSMLMGRVTMEMHYALPQPFIAVDRTPINYESYFVATKTSNYCIAIDTMGKLQWDNNEFDGQHLLVITSQKCPKQYHNLLSEQGISWIATGENQINLPRAMHILNTEFGIERLAITGGGNINGAFLQAGLLDEISIMFAPGIDGRQNMTAVFDGIKCHENNPTKLSLQNLDRIGDTIWARYIIKD